MFNFPRVGGPKKLEHKDDVRNSGWKPNLALKVWRDQKNAKFYVKIKRNNRTTTTSQFCSIYLSESLEKTMFHGFNAFSLDKKRHQQTFVGFSNIFFILELLQAKFFSSLPFLVINSNIRNKPFNLSQSGREESFNVFLCVGRTINCRKFERSLSLSWYSPLLPHSWQKKRKKKKLFQQNRERRLGGWRQWAVSKERLEHGKGSSLSLSHNLFLLLLCVRVCVCVRERRRE